MGTAEDEQKWSRAAEKEQHGSVRLYERREMKDQPGAK